MIPSATKDVPSKTVTPIRERILPQSAFTTSLRDRPVVHTSQHIDDLRRRQSTGKHQRRYSQRDEGSLLMTNDPNSIFYRHLGETFKEQSVIQARLTEEQEKFKLFEKYNPKIVEFLKDDEGHLKSKFDKVFII